MDDSTTGSGNKSDPAAVSTAVRSLPDLVGQAKVASFGLASPLFALRAGQVAYEAQRSADDLGADDPETILRQADVRSFADTQSAFKAGLRRAQVPTRKPADTATGATITGSVSRGDDPVEDVRVVASVDGQRVDYACTDANGAFGLDVPAGGAVSLSVLGKDGEALYRDSAGQTLRAGQQAYREIDLATAAKPCEPPPDAAGNVQPAPATMVDLVGRAEADAMALIRAQGLTLGARGTSVAPDKAGTVLSQKPAAGAAVASGDAVDIVVAITDQVVVPELVGLSLDDARAALLKASLQAGDLKRRAVPADKVGKVADQDPAAGQKVARSTKVSLVIGIASPGTKTASPDPDLGRIADIAGTRLAEATAGRTEPIEPADLLNALEAAGVATVKHLDALLVAGRDEARKMLGVRTLAVTDRIMAALRKARDEMDG